MYKPYLDEPEPIEDIVKKDEKWGEDYYFKLLNKSRRILLFDEINNCSADIICTKLKVMDMLDNKSPIYLEINSCGGSVPDGLAIIDTMERIKAPITTIITGEAASMSALVSISGNKRLITLNGCWMEHSISDLAGGFLEHIRDRTNFLIKLEKKLDLILKTKTKLTNRQMTQIKNGELWLFAEDCLKYGIVDSILKPNKK